MIKDGIVIGIGGQANSGKDTVTEILNYLLHVGVHNGKYAQWLINRDGYKFNYGNKNIFHFADPVKDNLSTIFRIPRVYFDSRKHKDELWYDIRNREFVAENELHAEHEKIYIEEIISNIDAYYNKLNDMSYAPIIKLRTLMQHYASMMKAIYDNDIWVKSIIFAANDAARLLGYALIGDVRYINEANAIRRSYPSTGRVILIERPDTDKDATEVSHNSEIMDFSYDYKITNDSTLMKLFFEVQGILYQIINENENN